MERRNMFIYSMIRELSSKLYISMFEVSTAAPNPASENGKERVFLKRIPMKVA